MSRLLGRALDQPIRPERGASMDSPLEDVNRPPGASEPPPANGSIQSLNDLSQAAGYAGTSPGQALPDPPRDPLRRPAKIPVATAMTKHQIPSAVPPPTGVIMLIASSASCSARNGATFIAITCRRPRGKLAVPHN